VSNGVKYKVMEDYSKIEVTMRSGESSIKNSTCTERNIPVVGKMSNGVVWQGDAYFYANGVLWALKLDDLSWRALDQGHPNAIRELSNRDDLLLLADENKGTLLFAGFRPSFLDCQFVIAYR
ncbi:hypothetical protein PENTCL1PPCAC_18958, partial [Pristionchus entomophagus]